MTLMEMIDLAIAANGGEGFRQDWCQCDYSVGYVPCEYCAIRNALLAMKHYLSCVLSDTERLDFLQKLTDEKAYSGQVILRDSTTGRGWRLHETMNQEGASSSVRDAIDKYMAANKDVPKAANEGGEFA